MRFLLLLLYLNLIPILAELCAVNEHVKLNYNSNSTVKYGGSACSSDSDCQSKCTANSTCAGYSTSKTRPLGAGQDHMCYLVDDGTVKCLGKNQYGQLGSGSTTAQSGFSTPSLGKSAIAVDAASAHSCALLVDKTIKCWGVNGLGQLGDGSTTDRSSPVTVSGYTNVEEIALAYHTGCARLADGGVKCWGYASQGLATGTINIGGQAKIIRGGGMGIMCVILTDDKLKCWGHNHKGQLGVGDTTNKNSPTEISFTGRYAVDIACGNEHCCVVLDDGNVRCSGEGDHGRLGYGNTDDRNTYGPNVELPSGKKAVKISCGIYNTYVTFSDGTATSWGSSSSFRLGYAPSGSVGDGPGEMGDNLSLIAFSTTVSFIDSFYNTRAAVLDDGKVIVWGDQTSGQLSTADTYWIGSLTELSLGTNKKGALAYSASYGPLVTGTGTSFTKTKGCTQCPAGYSNDALDDPAGAETTCDFIPCAANHHVLNGACTQCPGTATRAAGDSDPTVNTYCTCGLNQHVVSNVCTECPSGTTRPAGDDSSGADTICIIAPCAKDYRVKDNVCVPCPSGMTNAAGDTNANGDTYCDSSTFCNVNEYVSNHVCTACPAGTSAPYGSNPAGPDTVCTCGKNQYSDGSSCQSCSYGTFNNAGDLPSVASTCDDVDVCEANEYVSSLFLLHEDKQLSNAAGYSDAITDFAKAKRLCIEDTNCKGLTKDASNNYYLSDGSLSANTAYDAYEINRTKFMCHTCPSGGTRAAGDVATAATQCTFNNCAADQYVDDYQCKACPTGKESAATNPSVGNSVCATPSCAVNEYVKEGKISVLAVGDASSCAILNDDNLKCWGYGLSGNLGYGDTTSRGDGANEMGDNLPVVNFGAGKITKQISMGHYHTCAILNDDTLKCWGTNDKGQLGIGSNTNKNTPQDVNLGVGKTAKYVAAGDYYTCAILNDGAVKCWGRNMNGALGIGSTTDKNTPQEVNLGTGKTAKYLACGSSHTCAILNDDTLKCWGNAYNAGYGGTTNNIGDAANEMGDNLPALNLGTGKTAKQITIRYAHTCVILNDDTVKCWGNNDKGQLGYGDTTSRWAVPSTIVNLGTGKTAKQIAIGNRFTCAILNDDTVKCWGVGWNGRTGYGDTNDRSSPPSSTVNLGTGKTAKKVVTGFGHACAILNDDTVKCWGFGSSGRLGYGNSNDQTSPPSAVVDLGTGKTVAEEGGPECTACPAGSTNAAGDNPDDGASVCDFGTCGANEYVSSHVCTPCATGTFNDAGDSQAADTTCDDLEMCDANEYGAGNPLVCTACPGTGTTAAARVNETGTCTFPDCQTDQYSDGDGICKACPSGRTMPTPVNPSVASKCMCAENERVSGGSCTACPAGFTNAAGDNPCDICYETHCDFTPCALNHYVVGTGHSRVCTACTAGTFSPGGEVTACSSVEYCSIDQKVALTYVSDNTKKYGGTSCSNSSDCQSKCTTDSGCAGYTTIAAGTVIERGEDPTDSVYDITEDANGNLYYFHLGGGKFNKLDTSGTITTITSTSGVSCSIRLNGYIYSGTTGGKITRYDIAGGSYSNWASVCTSSTVMDITTDGTDLYVACYKEILKVTTSGTSTSIKSWVRAIESINYYDSKLYFTDDTYINSMAPTGGTVTNFWHYNTPSLSSWSMFWTRIYGDDFYYVKRGNYKKILKRPISGGSETTVKEMPGNVNVPLISGDTLIFGQYVNSKNKIDQLTLKASSNYGPLITGTGTSFTKGKGCVNCPEGFQNEHRNSTLKDGPVNTCTVRNCVVNEFSDGSVCKACPQYTGAASAGLVPTAGATQCTAITCKTDERVVSNVCTACDSTSYRAPGDEIFGGDTHCFCKDNHKVINKACVACEAGSSNPNLCYSGLQDHYCICDANYHVSNKVCTACPAGATRPAGDYGGNGDTHCTCGEDQHVVNHVCTPCPTGSKRAAGDDAGGENTFCSCKTNEHVMLGQPSGRLAAGWGHTCALLNDQTVKCWGHGIRLGYGTTHNRGDGSNEMGSNLPVLDLGTDKTAKQLSAGSTHTCAILGDDTVKCWGGGVNGRLGYGDSNDRGDGAGEMGDALPVVDLGTGKTAKQIIAGYAHTCAILNDDTLKCWGAGSSGRLGYFTNDIGDGAGEMGDNLAVVDLGTGRTAKKAAAGGSHTCAILDDDTLKCWGRNNEGQLGIGSTTTKTSPQDVNLGTDKTAKDVTAGYFHTCAILNDDTVKCWGKNNYGQLGYGNTAQKNSPASTTVNLGTDMTAKQIVAGYYHTCAILNDDSVKCWGHGTYGSIGNGNTYGLLNPPSTSVNLGTGKTAKQISTYGYTVCAVLDDDTVKCWGYNHIGQCGYGNTAQKNSPPSETVDLGKTLIPASPKCSACPAGSVRAAGDFIADGFTSCACPENFHVSGGQCVACVGGTRPAGDDPSAGDTHCVCNVDHKVVSNVCTACPAGQERAAGDDAGGADTSCLCKENFFSNGDGTCTACGTSAVLAAGSDPAVASQCACDAGFQISGANCVACASTEESVAGEACKCKENHYYDGSACSPCAAGSTRPAGDDKTATTTCTSVTCAENERVSGNACVACVSGMIRASGDDATGADTQCAYQGTSHTVTTNGNYAYKIDGGLNNGDITIRVNETHSFHRASSGDDFRIVSEADCEGKDCDKVKYSELPTSSLELDDAKHNEVVTVFTPTAEGTYYYVSTENAYRKGRIIVKWATCSITYPTTTLTQSCEMSAEETITGDLTITYSLSRLRAQSGDVPQMTAPANARHFTVNSNKLTLENIELKGGRGSEGGSILVNGGEIDANNVKFTGNTASTGGGAVRVKNSASKVKLSNVLFEDNQGSEGGAISIDATTATVEIHNTDFKNNRAATGNGGAIKSEAVLNITLTNFESNTANVGEGGSIDTTKDITMKDSSFKNNKARKGGAMRSVGNKVDLSNMVIEANEAIDEGGAFMAENSEFDVRSSTITANKAKKGAAFKTTSSGCTTACKKLRIRSSSISDNEATTEGGAVDFDGDADAEPQFWIQDTTMTGNKAAGSTNNFKKRGAKVKIKAIDSDVGTVDGGSVDTTCATDQCSGRAHSSCEVTANGTTCACDGTSRHLEGKECKVHKVCTGLGLDVEIRAPDKTHDRLCGSKDVAELTHKLDDKGKELANLIEAKLVAEGVAADQAYALAVEVFGEINKCE